MTERARIPLWQSLRVQLVLSAALMLAVTVAAVGYALTVNQRRSLTGAMLQTVLLQGRNVALSGEKSMLRPDPEFELCPLVTRVTAEVPDIVSLVVVDRKGAVQGHRNPSRVGTLFAPTEKGVAVPSAPTREGETLRESADSYEFYTPIVSAGSVVGAVHLTYSKRALTEGYRRSLLLIVRLSGTALLVGIALSVLFFLRISRPMGVLVAGIDTLARDLSFSIAMPTRNEFGVLADSFNRMALQIRDSQRALLAKERLAHEIALAREIQQSLIPQSVGAMDGFRVAHHYESAQEVGGDYFDVVPLDRSRVFVAMADVSGKGVSAMVVMAMTRMLVRQFAAAGISPREVLIRLNEALSGSMRRNMFVTAFVGVLDIDRREFHYSNAGHNPPVLYTGEGGCATDTRLDGVPLGLFKGDAFADTVVDYALTLAAGDVVLLYTDGLTESVNAHSEQFSLARVVDLTTRDGHLGPAALVRNIVDEERHFRSAQDQADDITVLAFATGVEAPVETGKS